MTVATMRLDLPLMAAGQAQKHVTHNEALLRLDGLVHLAVLTRDLLSPPANAADGARYLVGSPAAGAWQGQENRIAIRDGDGWDFAVPREGWLVYIGDERHCLVFDGTGWKDLTVRAAERLGINASADASHPLTVAGDGTLLTGATSDHRLTINKASVGATASVIFQSAYSGRAEMGLAGDNRFRFKVSADGAQWREALTIDPATGNIGIGSALPLAPLTVDSATNPAPPGTGSIVIQGEANKERLEIRSAGTPQPTIGSYASRGTLAAPAFPLAGDRLFAVACGGFNGSSFTTVAAFLQFNAEGDWSAGSQGSFISIWTTPQGMAATARAERLRVTGAGNVGIGTTTPTTTLHVAGPARVGSFTKAALPGADSTGAGSIIFVSDDAGGAVLAFSDGAVWRRVTDRAAVA